VYIHKFFVIERKEAAHQVRFRGAHRVSVLAYLQISPTVRSSSPHRQTFEIKSTQLSMLALLVKSSDFDAVAQELRASFGKEGETPDFFERDGLVVDLSLLPTDAPVVDFSPLVSALKDCQLLPVGVRGGSPNWEKAIASCGLVVVENDLPRPKTNALQSTGASPTPPPNTETSSKGVASETPASTALVVDKPLRSGQKVYAKGSDLIVLAMVNQGAEVVADGNIHVYAALRGKAMAGARGNTKARIFALSLEPELVSIAGVYRTSENPFPKEVHGKAAQVRLSDDGQEKLLIEAFKA
jgi:septum site-determining protein MinC